MFWWDNFGADALARRRRRATVAAEYGLEPGRQ